MTVQGGINDPIGIGRVAKPPPIRLPDAAAVFKQRAERFAGLACSSPLGDFLSFMAAIARAQSVALETLVDIPSKSWPRRDTTPLDRMTWQPDPLWQGALAIILDQLGMGALTAETRSALRHLAAQDALELDELAEKAVRFESGEAEAAEACLVFAALQVAWTRAAGLIDIEDLATSDQVGACPVCGSPPICSLVHSSGSLAGSRFLVCSLCATEWHVVRIKCANCGSTKGIAYLEVEGAGGLVKAETCDECRTYTKIIYTEKALEAEAFADDLASLGLDVLVGKDGWLRATPNPFLLPGAC